MAARDVAQALGTLASAARGVAATSEDPPARGAMLDGAADVLDKSAVLMEETKRVMMKPGDTESQQRLAQVGHRDAHEPLDASSSPLTLARCVCVCVCRWPRPCLRPSAGVSTVFLVRGMWTTPSALWVKLARRSSTRR